MNDDEFDYVSPPPKEVRHCVYVPETRWVREIERSQKLLETMRRVRDLLWYREAKAYGLLDEAIKAYEAGE